MVMHTLPFVGREAELDDLRATCSRGASILIVGATGMGKSRLASELASGDEFVFTSGVGAVELQASPYAVFRTLGLQWARLLDPASLDWSPGQLHDLAPIFPACALAGSGDVDVADHPDRTWQAVLRYLDALALTSEKQLVLIIDDLHQVDDDSLRLAAWLSVQPLDFALVASSDLDVPDALARLPRLVLDPLGRAALAALADDADAVLEVTGGVPAHVHDWLLGASRQATTTGEGVRLASLLASGRALADAGHRDASATLMRVFPIAERLGDGDSYARAALALPVGSGLVGLSMATDHRVVARLRGALAMDVEPAIRARVLVALAGQQHSSVSERDYFRILDDAEEVRRDLADAPLAQQLAAARVGPRRRVATAAELDEQLGRGLVGIESSPLPVFDLAVAIACRSGNLAQADELLRQQPDAGRSQSVLARWSVLRARAALAFARGSIDVARKLGLEALHVTTETRLDAVALDCFAFQIAAMLRERRKMADARPTIETWVVEQPSSPAFRATRALMYADLGDVAAAHLDLEVFFAQDLIEVRGLADGPASIGMALSAAFVVAASSAHRDDLTEWCARGYEMLQPVAREWLLVGHGALVEGPVVRVLALASSVVGELDRALAENAEAQSVAQASGALLFVAHAFRDRGFILRDAGRVADACVELAAAADRYRSIGLTQQAEWVEAQIDVLHSAAVVVDRPARVSVRGEFRRDQGVWHIGFGGDVSSCGHVKGMSMLAALLSNPDRPIAAGVLAAIGDDVAPTPEHEAIRVQSAQPLADDQALAAYRKRLDEILVELERADRAGDASSSARLTDEFDAITAELTSTRGLGGRTRNMATEDERARVRVAKSIRLAIRRIAQHAPGLAQHLERTVDTGRFCTYRTDRQFDIDWTLR